MKKIDDLNYYEVLQVPTSASDVEIEQAYQEALAVYSEDALASYCLFSGDDRENMLQLLETAYRTLADHRQRAAYDGELIKSGRFHDPPAAMVRKKAPAPSRSDPKKKKAEAVRPTALVPAGANDAYRQEIVRTIDSCRKDAEQMPTDKLGVINRLKFLRLKEKVDHTKDLSALEPELLKMLADMEDSNLRRRNIISAIIVSYTLLAILSFLVLTVTNAIMLPSFNIPYSILWMGLIGCVVSMWLRLPNIRAEQSLPYDMTIWFIICPPIAVIAAGIFFGLAQLLLSLFDLDVSDESWLFWILAFGVGFVNWIHFYERVRSGFGGRRRERPDRSR